MDRVSWLYEGTFDLEYKQYKYMAFHQKAMSQLRQLRLFPFAKSIGMLSNEVDRLRSSLARFEKIEYHLLNNKVTDTRQMDTMRLLIDFIKPRLMLLNEQLRLSFEEVNPQIQLNSCGLKSLADNEGFLSFETSYGIKVFRFEQTYYTNVDDPAIKLAFEGTIQRSAIKYIQGIITDITQSNFMPNVYSVSYSQDLPFFQTTLPLVKRKLRGLLDK